MRTVEGVWCCEDKAGRLRSRHKHGAAIRVKRDSMGARPGEIETHVHFARSACALVFGENGSPMRRKR